MRKPHSSIPMSVMSFSKDKNYLIYKLDLTNVWNKFFEKSIFSNKSTLRLINECRVRLANHWIDRTQIGHGFLVAEILNVSENLLENHLRIFHWLLQFSELKLNLNSLYKSSLKDSFLRVFFSSMIDLAARQPV